MGKGIRFVGLDVHGETIAVAVSEEDGSELDLGVIANRPEAVRGLIKRLGPVEKLRVCYEAGPCGYVLYWQLTGLEVDCKVMAPGLIPQKPGDRVKTDRRDAKKLARMYRAGLLTAVWVPQAGRLREGPNEGTDATEWTAVEGSRKGESSSSPCDWAKAPTRVQSARQLPTDDDHDGELRLDPRISD